MSDRIEPVEVLFLVIYLVIGLVAIGVEYLSEGHLSKDSGIIFVVWMVSVLVGSLLMKVQEKQDSVRDGINKLKEQNERILEQLKNMEKSLNNGESKTRYIDA